MSLRSLPWQIEADTQEDLVDTFDVEEVPTFLLLKGHTLLARNSGSNAQLLLSLLEQHTKSNSTPSAAATTSTAIPINTPAPAPTAPTAPAPAPPAETEEQLEERCKSLMNKHKVVLFMKGNPSAPKCGFSRKTVGLLREKGVEFAWFDILSDQAVREGLKKLNDWPSEWQRLLLAFFFLVFSFSFVFAFCLLTQAGTRKRCRQRPSIYMDIIVCNRNDLCG